LTGNQFGVEAGEHILQIYAFIRYTSSNGCYGPIYNLQAIEDTDPLLQGRITIKAYNSTCPPQTDQPVENNPTTIAPPSRYELQ
jgi:hypothetical protein